MTPKRLFRLAEWSAYVSAAALIVGVASYPLGEVISWTIFRTIRGLSLVILPISMLPIAVTLHGLHREDARTMSLLALPIGIAGMLAMVGLRTLQAYDWFPIEFYRSELQVEAAAAGAIGVWFLLVSYVVCSRRRWPTDLAWLGIIAGTGFIVEMLMTYSLSATPRDPTDGARFLRAFFGFMGTMAWLIAYPVWAV